LPTELPASLLVTLHLSNDYPSILPELLSMAGHMPARHPADREPLEKGIIYVAPPDYHLLLERGRGLLRLRCRVGHAYTADALRMAMSEATEDALWAAMRALEEKSALLRRMAPRAAERLREQYRQEAQGYDQHVETIRRILVESQELETKEQQARAEALEVEKDSADAA
jgi:CheB methylesterase